MNSISKGEALKVMKKLREVDNQMQKALESAGVDYYGLVRVDKNELDFWKKQFTRLLKINTSIKVRYK